MPTVEFECSIAAPVEAVWAFHEDIPRALLALSPPGDEVQVESADMPACVGSIVIINAKGPFGRIRWIAKYVEHVPPHPVAFGIEARFVDEQVEGPFKSWRHSHEMEAIDAKSTRLVDRITYRAPWGALGWVADFLLIRPKLRKMFAHRHAATKRILGGGSV